MYQKQFNGAEEFPPHPMPDRSTGRQGRRTGGEERKAGELVRPWESAELLLVQKAEKRAGYGP